MFTESTQLDQLKTDLHITKVDAFESKDDEAHDAVLDRLDDVTWIYEYLLGEGFKILINVGEYDQDCGVR
jgi:hypothetical protein